jgi:hypothetical protein
MRAFVRKPLTVGGCVGAAFAVLLISATIAQADYKVSSCGAYDNDAVFSAVLPTGGSIITNGSACPSSAGEGLVLQSSSTVSASKGSRGAWQAYSPTGLEIVAASVAAPGITGSSINAGGPWGGGVYWAGGGQKIPTEYNGGGSWSGFVSRYFGFQLVCGQTPCGVNKGAQLQVNGTVNLSVRETTGPSLSAPRGLWQTKDWVRGQWPLNFSGNSPSGMCGLNGTLNRIPLDGTSSTRNVAAWHQCSAPAVSDVINTAAYGQGPMPLYIAGWDAAGRTVGYTKTVYVDNSTPILSLSGATDASTAAGTQYVTASAGGSPSGIDGISCSVDGAPNRWYAGAIADVPVSGIGGHQVSCVAYSNAVDANGTHGASQRRGWSLKIGEPTEVGVGFRKYVGLKCHKVRELVTIPGHWVTRHRHGKKVRVKTKPKHWIRTVTKCHPRVKHVRIVVRVPRRHHGRIVRHHGKVVYRKKVERKRIVVQPHWQNKTKKHVPHGRSTTVSGWLGLTNGTALGGQVVQVLTAPDNGLNHFRVAATTTTASDGSWSVKLRAGPSRIIEASYAGSAVTQGTASGRIKEFVRGKIRLKSVTPRWVAWGHRVTIKGKLLGGHLPAGGVNVRMRIGLANAKTTFGVREHVRGNGRFRTTYTFGAGPARFHRRYWFQIATLPSGNYPYTVAHSNRIYVKVGGHPPQQHAHDKHYRRRHHN